MLIGTFLEYKSGALPLHTFVCWGPQIFHLHRKNRELKVREELFSATLECHLPTCMYGKFGEMFHLTVRICALVGYYAECCGNNLSVPSSRSLKMGLIGWPETSIRNYHSTLRTSRRKPEIYIFMLFDDCLNVLYLISYIVTAS